MPGVHFHLFGRAPGGSGALHRVIERALSFFIQEVPQRAGFGIVFHAENPGDGRARVFEASLTVEQRNDVGSVFNQRAIVQLALPEFFFGAAKVGFARGDFAHHVAERSGQLTQLVTATRHAVQVARGFIALLAHVLRGESEPAHRLG